MASVEHIDPSEINAAGTRQKLMQAIGNDASGQQLLSEDLPTNTKLEDGKRMREMREAYLAGSPTRL
jgi:hypothetical protein